MARPTERISRISVSSLGNELGKTMDTFIANAAGAFVGVIAGTFIQFFCQKLLDRSQRGKLLAILRREMQYNLYILDVHIQEVQSFRNAINANNIQDYYGYIKSTDLIYSSPIELLKSGILYEMFDKDHILLFQKLLQSGTPATEQWINSNIESRKKDFRQDESSRFANFLEGRFREHKKDIETIIKALGVHKE